MEPIVDVYNPSADVMCEQGFSWNCGKGFKKISYTDRMLIYEGNAVTSHYFTIN